jgi:hypothetical protein
MFNAKFNMFNNIPVISRMSDSIGGFQSIIEENQRPGRRNHGN